MDSRQNPVCRQASVRSHPPATALVRNLLGEASAWKNAFVFRLYYFNFVLDDNSSYSTSNSVLYGKEILSFQSRLVGVCHSGIHRSELYARTDSEQRRLSARYHPEHRLCRIRNIRLRFHPICYSGKRTRSKNVLQMAVVSDRQNS